MFYGKFMHIERNMSVVVKGLVHINSEQARQVARSASVLVDNFLRIFSNHLLVINYIVYAF